MLDTMAFLVPLLGVVSFLALVLQCDSLASLAGAISLTTTSMAVVYAVLIEFELVKIPFAKSIIAVTFVNDVLTLVGINFVNPSFDWVTFSFVIFLLASVVLVPKLLKVVVQSCEKRAIEMELRFVLAVLFGITRIC